MDTTSTYQYEPLEPEDIRLLVLAPALDYDDPLEGCLVHCPFIPDDDRIPIFEALSYAWAGSGLQEALYNEDSSNQLLEGWNEPWGLVQIRGNLASALRHLREISLPRVLWCDAICINQEKHKRSHEKSNQISRMSEIYSHARRVVAWLGPEADDSALAMRFLTNVATRPFYEVPEAVLELEAEGSELYMQFLTNPAIQPFYEAPEARDSGRVIRAFARLISRSWFKRLWVQQEIILADSEAVVTAGRDQMLWSQFSKAIKQIWKHFAWKWDSVKACQDDDFKQNLDATHWLSCWNKNDMLSVDTVLHFSKFRDCEDERDRVYALLGLLPKQIARAIEPDDDSTAKEVYKALVIESFKYYGHFAMLSLYDAPTRPTWVPDLQNWNECAATLQGPVFVAARSKGRFHVLEGDAAEVCGVPCDTIEQELAFVPKNCLDNYLLEVIGDVAERMSEHLTTLTQALIPDSPFQAHVEGLLMKSMDDRGDTGLQGREPAIVASLIRCLRGRSIFKTRSGSLVVGTSKCRPEDEIYVLLGCHHPMVLRRTHTGTYLIIGSAFDPCLMTGEALLGPLPSGWKVCLASTSRYASFQKGNAEPQQQDPRLRDVELPYGWRETVTAWGSLRWYHKDQKGLTEFDPRLTPEELMKRGVALRTLVLE